MLAGNGHYLVVRLSPVDPKSAFRSTCDSFCYRDNMVGVGNWIADHNTENGLISEDLKTKKALFWSG